MKKLLKNSFSLFLLLNIIVCSLYGQSKTGYPFIVDSLNKIQIPNGTSERLMDFYDILNDVIKNQSGQLSILNIGGSHIQADMFSNQVRLHFDSLVPDSHSERGIIFPFETAKTNNPHNYKVQHKGTWEASRNVKESRVAKLGVTGIAVTTKDTAAEISVKLNNEDTSHRWTFSKLTLLGYADSKLVEPVLYVLDTVLYSEFDSLRSTYTFMLPAEADNFKVKIVQKDIVPHSFTINGFLPENRHAGIVYHSIGVNGASVPSYLSCENFTRDLALINPDLIIFGIGINDATSEYFSDSVFIKNYDSLIARIETIIPCCAYIFVTNNDSYRKVGTKSYVVNTNGLIAQQAFYSIAQKHEGGVWDMFALMGGLRSMRQWELVGLAQKDKVHFTKKGYKLLGDMFYSALIDSYNNTMISISK